MNTHSRLRELPSISALLEHDVTRDLLTQYPRQSVLRALREAEEECRSRLAGGEDPGGPLDAQVVQAAVERLAAARKSGLRTLINATGVILHTNLGRSVLAESAARAVYEIARSYSNLEADLEAGRRSSRHVHIESRLRDIIGAEAGAVFNNNAAAIMLALAAIARDREVIVSRGQLIEIGGSFRIPEVIEQSGCILREVGATNRTHLRDYEAAINENTAAILHAHHSNYRIIGFASEPTIEELAQLAQERGLPLIEDLGSGALLDLAALGVGDEPTVARSLAAGADVVTFSGDKLLGGPQCGIAVGRPDLIEQMKTHPFARAVRVGKMTIAALAATLDLIADPDTAIQEIPTLRAATEPLESVRQRADSLAAAIAAAAVQTIADIAVSTDHSARVGGGSLPEQELETAAVRVVLPGGPSPNELARRLRLGEPAVYPRVQGDALVLDARTIFPHQVDAAASAVAAVLNAAIRDERNLEGPPDAAVCAAEVGPPRPS